MATFKSQVKSTDLFFGLEMSEAQVQRRFEQALNLEPGTLKPRYDDTIVLVRTEPDQTGFMIGSVRLA